MNNAKSPSATVKFDGIDFHADHAAKMPLADFQASQAHQWPDLTEAQRKANLASVHGKATAAVREAAKNNDHGNSSSDAKEVPGARPAGGAGAGH